MSVSNEFFYNNTTLAGEAIFFDPVKIGPGAGDSNQGNRAIAIGTGAGNRNQGDQSIAIGYGAGYDAQVPHSIVINANSEALTSTSSGMYVDPIRSVPGNTSYALYYDVVNKELTYANAVTKTVGNTIAWDSTNVSVESPAGPVTITVNSIQTGKITADNLAIGWKAALVNQASAAISIGKLAGTFTQLADAIAIGNRAGANYQGTNSIAIGNNAATGVYASSISSTIVSNVLTVPNPVGTFIPKMRLFNNNVDTGASIITQLSDDLYGNRRYSVTATPDILVGTTILGALGQEANTIVLNASGVQLDTIVSQPNALYIAPIRSTATNSTSLVYNSTTKEVTTGFPCLPTYASDAAANAAITAASLVLTEGMMYVDTTLHKVKVYLNNVWVTLSL